MSMNRNALAGLLLLALGVLIAFKVDGNWSSESIFELFWATLFVIPVGVFFHWLYFFLGQRGVGLLVPGGIVLTVGIVCQIATLFDSWDVMWPGFILSVAVGLFELYLFGSRNRWLMIPIGILTTLSMLFFLVFGIGALLGHLSSLKPLLVLGLVIAGFAFLFLKKKENPVFRQPWE